MKLTALLLFAVIMQVSAGTYAQRVSLSLKEAKLLTIFDQISDQTGYSFVVTNSILKDASTVTINVKNAALKEVLTQVFSNQPFEFTITNNSVLVKRKETSVIDNLIGRFTAIDVKGKVVDEKGLPLPGATVKVKESSRQVLTNTEGNFSISGIDEKSVLVISFLGYKTRELNAARDLGTISLEVSTGELNEVTVSTGYQVLSKERVTGSFSTVSAKKLEQQRLSNIGSLLEGRIPGYNNGIVRGTTSMSQRLYPLYVVDGFPIDNINLNSTENAYNGIPGLNLEDIESITVLKDAAAASIYGARAANGVVVIVTRKGKKGKPQISASSTWTVSPYRRYNENFTNSDDVVGLEREWAANNPNLKTANAATYAANLLQNIAYPSQGINSILRYYAGQITQSAMDAKLNELASAGYQYYDDVEKYSKRNPFYQQYNLNVGAASEKNAVYASVTYRNNKLEDKYAGDQTLGFNINNTTQISKWLSMEVGNYLSYNEETRQTFNTLSPFYYTYMPYDRLVNPDGSNFTVLASSRLSANTMNVIQNNGLYSMDITPLDEQSQNLGKLKNLSGRSFIKMNAKIDDWISYNASFQYEYATGRLNRLYDKNTYYVRSYVNSFATGNPGTTATFNVPYGNINYDQNRFNNSYNFRQQLNIDKTFADKHNLTAIAGTELRNSKLSTDDKYLYGYDPQTLSNILLNEKLLGSFGGGLLGGNTFISNVKAEDINRFISLYANLGYAYDGKYLFTSSVRWDRSNLWGTSSKYQNTPIWSFGAGWNIYKESFFDVAWVDVLKLRVSHGIAGNVDPSNAPFITARYSANNNVGGVQGVVATRPNPLLSWEKTTTTNAGVDFTLFNNRLTGTLDYYYKQGKDLLSNTMGVPTEGFGYSTYAINNGQMTNKGIEVSLSGDLVRSNDLTWNLGVQYANNKNKVTYVNVEAPVYFLQLDYPLAYPRIGNPYNAIYSYRWAGLNSNGLPQVYNDKGEKVLASPANLQSVYYAGTTVPVYSGSLNNLLEYKNFTFSFLLTFEGGHKMRNTFLPVLGAAYNTALGGYVTQISAVNKDIVNRWKNPGDEANTNIPRLVFAEDPAYNSQSMDIYRNADINVIDASNLRLRNISLAYRLPEAISKKAAMSNVRFQFNVENAFTLARSKAAKYLLNGYRTPNYVWGVYVNF